MSNATLLKTAKAVLAVAEVTLKAAEAALEEAESVSAKAKIESVLTDRRECVAREKAFSAASRVSDCIVCVQRLRWSASREP